MNQETMMQVTMKGYEANMTLDADSWVAICAQSGEQTQIVYFNSKQERGELEDRHTFEDFANIYIEENFIYGDDCVVKIENNKASASGGAANEEEEVDEEARRCYKVITADCMIINIYREEDFTKTERVEELVKKTEKELADYEYDVKDNYRDNQEYNRNPMAYYGLSQKDFL